MPQDKIVARYSFNYLFWIYKPEREAWINGTKGLPLGGSEWYADGSKGGRTDAGIYGSKDGQRISISLECFLEIQERDVKKINGSKD